jgi:hypothetical protein
MLTSIRAAIRWVVDTAHNAYAKAPAAVQTFLMLAAFGLFAAAQGFGWTLPTTGTQFSAELAAIAAMAYAVLVPLFQAYIQPNLLAWLIDLLEIHVSAGQEQTRSHAMIWLGKPPKVTLLWRAA